MVIHQQFLGTSVRVDALFIDREKTLCSQCNHYAKDLRFGYTAISESIYKLIYMYRTLEGQDNLC